jgi:hypothetical protein
MRAVQTCQTRVFFIATLKQLVEICGYESPTIFDKFIVKAIWARGFVIWELSNNLINFLLSEGVSKVLKLSEAVKRSLRLNSISLKSIVPNLCLKVSHRSLSFSSCPVKVDY